MIQSLQAGRGIAAILLLLYHMQGMFRDPLYWSASPVGTTFDFGFAGVHFFFVLSGFIIALGHWRDGGQPAALIGYGWKRFARVYPLYWLVTAAIFFIYLLAPNLGSAAGKTAPMLIAGSLTLAPFAGAEGILAVAWTLFHAIAFYCLFALFILRRDLGVAVFALWLVAILTGPQLPDRLAYLVSPMNILFFIGVLSFWIYRFRSVPVPLVFAIGGVVLFVAMGQLDTSGNVYGNMLVVLGFGTGAACAILGFATLENSGKVRIPSMLVLLGSASYSLYLIHYPLIAVSGKLLLKLGMRNTPLLAWAIIASTTILVSIAVHLAIERPLTDFVRRLRPHKVSFQR